MLNDFLENQIIAEDMDIIYDSRKNWDEFKDTCIYISGASGMIASYLVMYLIYLNERKNHHIEISAGIRSIEKAKKRFGIYVEKPYFHLLSTDVICPVDASQKWDYIIHAASLASPQYYGSMPVETMLPNIIGTYELLKHSVQNPPKSFLFFSSGSIYGKLEGLESISENDIGAFDFTLPGNVYGESKRCGEALCYSYFREYHTPVKVARIHHTYGPTLDAAHDKRVFSEFVNNILHDQDIVMKSDGSSKRAFCYLSDSISGLLKILLDGVDGESYNIGNADEYVSIGELAQILVSLYPQKGLKVVYEKRDDGGYVSNPQKAEIGVDLGKLKALGWDANVSVKDGFERTVRALEM
ncbi:MAG: NAD-dependent epimerase/dehydratase family protein [Clostridia bacterium]|nr:NAD-dependent epimerase/dehydratase family protein [Clostridia bacterium]